MLTSRVCNSCSQRWAGPEHLWFDSSLGSPTHDLINKCHQENHLLPNQFSQLIHLFSYLFHTLWCSCSWTFKRKRLKGLVIGSLVAVQIILLLVHDGSGWRRWWSPEWGPGSSYPGERISELTSLGMLTKIPVSLPHYNLQSPSLVWSRKEAHLNLKYLQNLQAQL